MRLAQPEPRVAPVAIVRLARGISYAVSAVARPPTEGVAARHGALVTSAAGVDDAAGQTWMRMPRW